MQPATHADTHAAADESAQPVSHPAATAASAAVDNTEPPTADVSEQPAHPRDGDAAIDGSKQAIAQSSPKGSEGSLSPFLVPLPLPGAQASPPLIPPLQFGLVCSGVYRSACPSLRNLSFLRGLGLRSVLYLSGDSYPSELGERLASWGVSVRSAALKGNIEPFQSSDFAPLRAALLYACDTRNHPLLLHCHKGSHRTGCVVGLLRRLSGWSLAATFAEYRSHSGGWAASAPRDLDRLMMECMDLAQVKSCIENNVPLEHRAEWLA